MAFGVGFLEYINSKQTLHQSGKTGSWCIILIGAMGLLTNLFPRGASATLIGNVHLILVGLLSLGTILATLLVGLRLRKQPGNTQARTHSLVACAEFDVTGGLAAAAAATVSPLMGLIHRLTIGTLMLWVLFLGIKSFSSSPNDRS